MLMIRGFRLFFYSLNAGNNGKKNWRLSCSAI
jgi:hypothetical protein